MVFGERWAQYSTKFYKQLFDCECGRMPGCWFIDFKTTGAEGLMCFVIMC